jgi:beta-lactamase regulating signal transducer with metallopeptidase domain
MIQPVPCLWGVELSRSAAGLMVHFLWLGAVVWFIAAALRSLLCRSSAECRYLLAVLSLAALAASAGMAGVLTFTAIGEVTGVFAHPVADVAHRNLPVAWSIGAGLLLLNALRGLGAVRLMRFDPLPVPAALNEQFSRLAQALRVIQPVGVALAERVRLPVVVGVIRPVVLLPQAAVNWSADCLEAVLLHELVHVRRHDNLVILVQRIVESLLWFHPAVWSVSRWIDEEREYCCDDLVLTVTGSPESYAETLIALSSPPPPRLCSALRRNSVHARLRRILFHEELAMSRSLRWEALPIAVCCLAGGVLAVGIPAQENPLLPADGAAVVAATDAAAPNAPAAVVPVVAPSPQVVFVEPFRGKTGANANFVVDQAIFTTGLDLIATSRSDLSSMRAWGPEQAIGEPNTPEAGDQATAWASRSPDDMEEWLICEYENAVMVAAVSVHETYNPGALYKVTAFNDAGEEVIAWEGEDPTPRAEPKGISVIPVKLDFATRRIKLYIDSPAVPGWNEIDAVAIEDENAEKQWAINIEASTTYAEPNVSAIDARPSYSPEQATGEPDTMVAGDSATAWASLTPDGQEEWLICRYETPQQPIEVVIHENYAPGAVHKITALSDSGEETLLWEGTDPTPTTEPRGVSIIPVAPETPVQAIKIYIDSVNVPNWNEIDAVGLRDADGNTAWAVAAEASSSYGSQTATFVESSIVYVSVEELQQLQQDVATLKEQITELQQLRDEIKDLKELLEKEQR